MFALAKFSQLASGGAGESYTANAVDFDGTNDYLTRGAGLTGAADGKEGLFSCWVRIDGGDATQMSLFHAWDSVLTTRKVEVFRSSGNLLFVTASRADGVGTLSVSTSNSYASGATWLHILSSWKTDTAGARHLYISDVSDLVQNTFLNNAVDYTVNDWGVGARANDGSTKFNGCMAELYFTTSYLDLSVEANRRKFISGGLRPVSLGADGSLPTGSQPLVYLKGVAASFGTNSGSGGNFTITGTLDAASTTPSG